MSVIVYLLEYQSHIIFQEKKSKEYSADEKNINTEKNLKKKFIFDSSMNSRYFQKVLNIETISYYKAERLQYCELIFWLFL
jgi:hypothetical protein